MISFRLHCFLTNVGSQTELAWLQNSGDMTQRFHDEDGTLQHLADRLAAAYPDVDARIVEATVDEVSRELRGAKLKTFLPILAERKARLALDRYRAARAEGEPEGA